MEARQGSAKGKAVSASDRSGWLGSESTLSEFMASAAAHSNYALLKQIAIGEICQVVGPFQSTHLAPSL